jgi:nanoRNase/pAp phosphatase (c-di-AMP/oligoRNAs hydrolase)
MPGVDENNKFIEMLEKHRGESHVVILPSYPDPDAIASAYAHRLISACFDIQVSIFYGGHVHPRLNLALIKLLDIDIIPIEEKSDIDRIQAAILMEDRMGVSEKTKDFLDECGIPVILCLQKENSDGIDEEILEDCQPCTNSAIYARYMEDGLLELNRNQKEHVVVATTLLYGILSATDSFTHASEGDFKAAAFLSSFRDPELLEHIMNQSRSKQIMDIIRRALGNRELIESYSIAGIGYLRAKDREALSQAADFLLTEDNVHTAIVYGIMTEEGQETLSGAIRTSKITIHPEEFIASIFGEDIKDHFEGGEELPLFSDDFNIPILLLTGNPTEEFMDLKWKVYDSQVKFKLYSKLGVPYDKIQK